MKLIDLSHEIEENMPLFPGTSPIAIETLHTVAKDGFAEKRLSFTTHVGTHLDAPAHMLSNGRTMEALPVEQFWGRAKVADVRSWVGKEIPADFVRSFLEPKAPDFLLLYTGFAARWGNPDYFGDFPVLSETAARVLADSSVKGLGLDAPSVDPMTASVYTIHLTLFKAGKIIIENLTNLHLLRAKEFTLSVFPLKVKNADGMPVRAVAILEE